MEPARASQVAMTLRYKDGPVHEGVHEVEHMSGNVEQARVEMIVRGFGEAFGRGQAENRSSHLSLIILNGGVVMVVVLETPKLTMTAGVSQFVQCLVETQPERTRLARCQSHWRM